MKKRIFYFIAGVFFITLISANTVNVMAVKPQLPKSTIVEIVKNNKVENYIKNHIRQGFIVKSCSITADRSGGSTLVIMEKY